MPAHDPAAQLVLNRLDIPPDARVLVFAPPSRDFVTELANRAAQVDVYPLLYSAWVRLEGLPGNVTRYDDVLAQNNATCDAAVIFIPKGRALLRLLLWRFARVLQPGGRLYIAGANGAGAKSAIKDAGTLLGDSITLDYKSRQRVGLAVKRGETLVYPAQWGDAPPDTPQPVTFDTPRGPVQLAAMPGVFSWEKLDDGTRFLLAHLAIDSNTRHVLDLGCGLGAIGFSLANQADHVTLTDDNLLAVHCAQVGARHNRFRHARAQASDVYSTLNGQRFDLIACNPPFHKGIDVTYGVTRRIIGDARNHLIPGGRLVIVANAFLPYEPLFEANFTQWREVARDNRYKILAGRA